MAPKKTKEDDSTSASSSSPLPSSASGYTAKMASGPAVTNAKISNAPLVINDLSGLLTILTESFSATLNTCVEKLIDAMDKKLTTRLDIHEVQTFDLNKKLEKLEKNYSDLLKENQSLRDSLKSHTSRVDSMDSQIDDAQQHSRNANILLHGLSSDSSTETNLESRVLSVLNSNLGLGVTATDIQAVHRMQRTMTGGQSGMMTTNQPRPPPVVI